VGAHTTLQKENDPGKSDNLCCTRIIEGSAIYSIAWDKHEQNNAGRFLNTDLLFLFDHLFEGGMLSSFVTGLYQFEIVLAKIDL
jgi:hypothetical protein